MESAGVWREPFLLESHENGHLMYLLLVITMGNPGVFFSNPHSYPVPLPQGPLPATLRVFEPKNGQNSPEMTDICAKQYFLLF